MEIGIYKSFAFDIVSSPTSIQKWDGGYIRDWYWSPSVNNEFYPNVKYSWNVAISYYGWWLTFNTKKVNDNIDFLTYTIGSSPYTNKGWDYYDRVNNKIFTWSYLKSTFFNTLTNTLVVASGSNMYFYNVWSGFVNPPLLQTINMVSRFWHNVSVKMWTFPVQYTLSSWEVAFAYQGTDNKSYKILLDYADGDLPIESAGTGSVLPLGKFTYNDLLLARQIAWSGSRYVWNASDYSSQFETSTGYVLTSFNTFQNPIAYFTTSASTVVKWDMNCITPGYDSCTLNGWVFKCTNSAGTLSPWGELCGGTVWTWPPPTCSDGIKNQNETMIDIGGVCGATCYDGVKNQDEVDIDYGGVCGSPTFSFSGFTCASQTRVSPPTVWSGGYNFGQYPTLSEDHTTETSWTFDFYSGSTHEDYFEAYGIASGSLVYSGSLKSLYADIKSTLIMWEPNGQFKMNIDIFSYIGDDLRKLSYIAFNTKRNSLNQGSVFFKDKDGVEHRELLLWVGWWIAVAYTKGDYIAYEWRVSELAPSFSFYWMEVWYAADIFWIVTECENGQWTCEVNTMWNICSAQYYYWKARGSCWFVDNKCLPTTPLTDADWSHTITPVNNPPSTNWPKVDENWELDVGKDIFSCSETGFSVLICPFQIIGRIWEKVTDFVKTIANIIQAISSIGSSEWTGNIIGFIFPVASAEDLWKSLISPWFVTQTGALDPDYAPTYSWADYAGINNAMFTAGDNTKNMADGGIKWLFAFAQWALILLMITWLIVIVMYSLAW